MLECMFLNDFLLLTVKRIPPVSQLLTAAIMETFLCSINIHSIENLTVDLRLV